MATRPLRLEELAEVLAFDFDEASGGIPQLNADWRREDQEQAVLSTCSSLITVVHDGDSRVVQFSHFSVKEYLTSDRLAVAVGDISFHHIALTPAHTILAQACLGVLLQLDDDSRGSYLRRFPLVEYAARYWVDHAQFEEVSLHLQDGIENMFDRDKPHLSRWIQVYNIDDWWVQLNNKFKGVPVYYAALCGFSNIVEKFLHEHPEHVSATCGARGTALHAASSRNRVNIGQLLLKHRADVNALGPYAQTPLHVASILGNFKIGQCLLEHGADVDARSHSGRTPLLSAADNGHFEVVRMLLGHNPDINAQDDEGHTALYRVAGHGHIHIGRILLDNGADHNSRANDRSTPLHYALRNGKLEVVHLLLERGADVDVVDAMGRTAYQIALDRGHDEIAQLLSGRVSRST